MLDTYIRDDYSPPTEACVSDTGALELHCEGEELVFVFTSAADVETFIGWLRRETAPHFAEAPDEH